MVKKTISLLLSILLLLPNLLALVPLNAFAQSTFDASTQVTMSVPNNPIAGTTLNKLAIIDASGTASLSGTTDTNVPAFIVLGNAGTSGNAKLATAGSVLCTFDASGGTAQHFVQVSTSVAGTCHDAGVAKPTSGWVIGQLLSSPGANANGLVLLSQSSGGLPAGTADGKIPIWNNTSKQWEALDPLMQGTQAAGSSTQPNPLGLGGWDYTNGVIRNLAVDPTTKALLTVLPPQPLLNVTDFTDVTAASPTRGDIITAQGATPKWGRLGIGSTNTLLHGGTEPGYSAVVQGDVTNGFVDLASNQTVAGVKTYSSISKHDASVLFKGPVPWYDVKENGLLCDFNGSTGTDDTTAMQALVTSICTSPGSGRIFIPIASACRLTAQISIPCQVKFEGEVANGGAFGGGSFLVDDRTAPTATAGLLNWTGNNLLTQGIGGGIDHLVIWRAVTKTAGTAIALTATDCNHRPGHMTFDDVRVTGDGTYSHALWLDGTACSTSGSQGIRDITLINFQPFQTTVDAMNISNAVHFFWCCATTSPTGGGNADVVITGGGTATTNSTDVWLAGAIAGNLTLQNADTVRCAGCTVSGTLSSTSGTTNSVFTGFAGAYNLVNGVAVFGNDTVATASQDASFSNAFRASWVVAGPAIPSNIGAGQINANSSATGGTVGLGSDGNFGMRRNNGSSAGSNLAWSWDGFATTPFQYDNVNGGTSTLPINKIGQADIVADSGAINTTDTVIVKTPALLASRLVAGTHIRATLTGTCTSTVGNTSTFTLRWGTNGTTADGTVAALVTNAAATSGTNNGFKTTIDFTVRVPGASATSDAFMETLSDANIGISATPSEKFVAGTAFNTTTASAILSISYKSAASTTTSTFKTAVIEIVQN